MATMDIFEGDAFTIIELTRALENIPFKPAILSGAGLFGSRGVRARTVMIESRDGTLSLIPFSERGSVKPDPRTPRDARLCLPAVQEAGRALGLGNPGDPRLRLGNRRRSRCRPRSPAKLGRLRKRRREYLRVPPLQRHPGRGEDPGDGCQDGLALSRGTTHIGCAAQALAQAGLVEELFRQFDGYRAPRLYRAGRADPRCVHRGGAAITTRVEDTLGPGWPRGQVQAARRMRSAFFADRVAHKEVRETAT